MMKAIRIERYDDSRLDEDVHVCVASEGSQTVRFVALKLDPEGYFKKL